MNWLIDERKLDEHRGPIQNTKRRLIVKTKHQERMNCYSRKKEPGCEALVCACVQ